MTETVENTVSMTLKDAIKEAGHTGIVVQQGGMEYLVMQHIDFTRLMELPSARIRLPEDMTQTGWSVKKGQYLIGTRLGFFASIPEMAIVEDADDQQYIFVGFVQRGLGPLSAKLIHRSWFSTVWFTWDTLIENPERCHAGWTALTVDVDCTTEFVTATESERAAIRQLALLESKWELTEDSLKSQRAVNDKYLHDWNRLNELLNEYADEELMCSRYEETLDNWNREFKMLSLEGRIKDYLVSVEIPGLLDYPVDLEVEAKGVIDAMEQVRNMDCAEVLDEILAHHRESIRDSAFRVVQGRLAME